MARFGRRVRTRAERERGRRADLEFARYVAYGHSTPAYARRVERILRARGYQPYVIRRIISGINNYEVPIYLD
jgi:hypothetical protein